MENLKKLREALNLSQQDLANKLGISQAQIHAYEAGLYNPRLVILKGMAKYFNTSLDYIVGHSPVMEPADTLAENASDDKFDEVEKDFIEKIRQLSQERREALLSFLATFMKE